MHSLVSAKYINMTHKPASVVNFNSTVQMRCESDSAKPTAQIIWSMSGAVINNSDEYRITVLTQEGDFNAKKAISTLTYTVTKQHRGKVFKCYISEHTNVYSQTTVQLPGKYKITILSQHNFLMQWRSGYCKTIHFVLPMSCILRMSTNSRN